MSVLQLERSDALRIKEPRAQRPRLPAALPYLLVAPAMLVLLLTVAYPIGFNLFASLHRWNMLESDVPQAFVATATLAKILQDPYFWNALKVTGLFTLLAVAIEFSDAAMRRG